MAGGRTAKERKGTLRYSTTITLIFFSRFFFFFFFFFLAKGQTWTTEAMITDNNRWLAAARHLCLCVCVSDLSPRLLLLLLFIVNRVIHSDCFGRLAECLPACLPASVCMCIEAKRPRLMEVRLPDLSYSTRLDLTLGAMVVTILHFDPILIWFLIHTFIPLFSPLLLLLLLVR